MAKQPQPSTADQKAAYARAEQAIKKASETGAIDLHLSGEDFQNLTTLPPEVASLTALSDFMLSGTQVSDLNPLAGLNNLKTLDLRHSQVSDLSAISSLTALTDLILWGTQVSDITPLVRLTNLTRFGASNTQVSDLSPLTDLIALTSLDLEHTQVSDVSPLAGLTALNSLGLNSTQVSDITPLAGLTTLTSLGLDDTQVSDVSALAGLTALRHLYLLRTKVSDIAPLAGLTALTSLDLSRTQVSDIAPLAGLTALTRLDLDGMQVSDLSPLLKLTQLEKNPSENGLSFENTAAAKADKSIANMAKIKGDKARATALFAHLRDVEVTNDRLERLDTRLNETMERLTTFEDETNPLIEAAANTLEVLDKGLNDAKERLTTFEDDTKARIEKAESDYQNSLEATAKAFSETNAIKAPVELWKEKRKEHQENSDTARNSFYWSLVATAIAVIILAAILIFRTDVAYAIFTPVGCDIAKPETCKGFSARGLSILGLIAMLFTCLLWYVRMQMKLFLSERHLALDARERTAFAQAYVGFLGDKDSSDEAAGQRSAVYAALFRPAPDGIIKEDSGLDPSIAAALSKFLSKS